MKENKIMVSFRMEREWIDRAEAIAEGAGVTRSKLLRTLVQAAITGIENRREKNNYAKKG